MTPTPAGVRFRLAEPADNDALLDLARTCPMEGPVTVRVERAPDFFALPPLQGDPWLVAVAEDATGRIVACSSLVARDVYVDGQAVRCMYGGDLRVAHGWRGTGLVRQLHDWCWERTREAGVDLWYFSIMEGNPAAQALPRQTPGRPLYRLAGRAVILGIAPGGPVAATGRGTGAPVERLTDSEVPDVAALLDRENRRRDFAPTWTAQRLVAQLHAAPGLSVADVRVVRRGGEIVGSAAAWDQRAVQRTMVSGDELRLLYLTHLAVTGDDPSVFRALVGSVLRDRRAADAHLVVFALDAAHPLLDALDGFPVQHLTTEVWAGAWPGTAGAQRDVGGRPVHHEASHVN